MAQTHSRDGFGHADRFGEVEFRGLASLHGTEGAGAGADVAEDHKCGGASGPAFAHVWALGGLADGVELVFVYDMTDCPVSRPRGELGSKPLGFPQRSHGLHAYPKMGKEQSVGTWTLGNDHPENTIHEAPIELLVD